MIGEDGKKTVLILGAGASAVYGYPLGVPLIKAIHSQKIQGNFESILKENGFEVGRYRDFQSKLKNSIPLSIDDFLDKNDTFMDMGKFGIAWAMIKAESHETIVSQDDKNWYDYLLSLISGGVSLLENVGKNRLSVVTFNYDRSFDHALITSLENGYGREAEANLKVFNQIPIVHVHGQIAKLPLQGGTGCYPYGTDVSTELLRNARSEIKTISEARGNPTGYAKARKLIRGADIVIFLGWGYIDSNMKRLDVPFDEKHKHHRTRRFFGSVFKMTPAKVLAIRNKYPGLNTGRGDSIGWDCLEFLKQTNILDE